MSSNDDSVPGWVFWWLAIMLWCLALYILAFAVFISLLLTVVCIIAMRNGDLTAGSVSISADHAATLVSLGIFGALLVPLFLGFCQLFIGIEIPWQYFLHFVLGGYSAGLLGVGVIGSAVASSASVTTTNHTYLPPAPSSETRLSGPERFQYASWDDEESSR